MDLNEIKALMDRFDTSACTVLELEEGNLRLRLEKGTAPVSVAPEIQAAPAAPGAAAPQPRGRPPLSKRATRCGRDRPSVCWKP